MLLSKARNMFPGQKEGGNDHQAGHHCPQRYRAQVGVTGWRQTQTSPFQTAVPPGLGHQGRNVTHTPPTSPMCTCLPASPTGTKIGTTHPSPKASFVGGNTPNKPNPKALLEGVTNNIKAENIAQNKDSLWHSRSAIDTCRNQNYPRPQYCMKWWVIPGLFSTIGDMLGKYNFRS